MHNKTKTIKQNWSRLFFALTVAMSGVMTPALAQEKNTQLGDKLVQDVRTYGDFGIHRFGSKGENQALEWIKGELTKAGLKVETQPIELGRQLVVDKAQVTLDGVKLEAFPHWWPPEQNKEIILEAPLKPDNESAGAFAWLRLPYERGAYLNAQHRQKIMEVAAHKPLAIILTIDNPAGSIFTYNVNQEDSPWPMPVIVVPARLAEKLELARKNGATMKIDLATHYERNVKSYNVIGRLDNGAARTAVISTPVSSWFTSTCERGPGIALFLATARHVAQSKANTNYMFVATVGHEIGQGGMDKFIHTKAPSPDKVSTWLHYGASFACYGWKRDSTTGQWVRQPNVDPNTRALLASESMEKQTALDFKDVPALPFFGAKSNVGELSVVRSAGYLNYLGMTGLHRYFHTPEDNASLTGPELLEPLAKSFFKIIDDTAAR